MGGGGFVEAVCHQEVIQRIGFVLRTSHELEHKPSGFLGIRIRSGLHEEDIARDNDHLAQRLFTPDQLHREAVLRPVLEMPVEISLIMKDAILGTGAQDAIGMALEPAPKTLELQNGSGLYGDAHADLLGNSVGITESDRQVQGRMGFELPLAARRAPAPLSDFSKNAPIF